MAPRPLAGLIIALLCLAGLPANAATPSVEELWAIAQRQQAQIDTLARELEDTRAQLSSAERKVAVTEEQLGATVSYVERLERTGGSDWAERTTLGGYGEMHYNNLDADDGARDLEEIDFHRFVAFINHDFTDRIRFFSEVEIEHSLVADTADGSNGGEVELEQAYLEFDLDDHHQARGGLFLIPVGILNETHEPNTFYGVERNDVESIIIPSTWWEGGAAMSGRYANGLSWDVALTSGLEVPVSGGNAYRIRSGRQKVALASAENLAITGRVKYTGIPGLELAASVNYQDDASQAGGDDLDDATLMSVHGIWSTGPFSLRALWAQWDLAGDGPELADADRQTGWYVEPSFRLGRSQHDWGFYTRYQDVEGARAQDRFDQWELGLNYWPTGNVVIKFDYRDRDHNTASESGRDFNGIDLGVGYQF
jgi:hypothetical protein